MSTVRDLPHIIKYMGSKRNILDFVVDSILEIKTPDTPRFYDIFAGSSIVGGAFREIMPVTCNDIQEYSKVLGGVYLNNYHWEKYPDEFLDEFFAQVEERVLRFKGKYGKLEFDYEANLTFEEILAIEEKQKQLVDFSFNGLPHLFTKYFSGTYWSYEQCVWIDAIASLAREQLQHEKFLFDMIHGALMFAMAYCSQSTGHYAQYRDLKKENVKDIVLYRRKEIFPLFKNKCLSLKEIYDGSNNTQFEHRYSSLNFTDAIDEAKPGSIVYADPPYQFVHYSRFYHTLETLVRYDYPEIKYKGRYRTDRYQSPFCIRTKVKKAFTDLFRKAYSKQSSLVLSYSNSGMITLNELEVLAKEIFTGYKVYIKELDYSHSTMGRQGDKSRTVKEYLLICSRP